jgi:phosphomannomutase/phosphoglucomutase
VQHAIFREYSIRGHAERDLPDEVVQNIGQAISSYFYEEHITKRGTHPRLVMGHDVRQSSPRISWALMKGLMAAGADVIDIGLVPTPTLNFAVDHFAAAGGIMITASHNPPHDNGLKLRADLTLTGPALQEIYALAMSENFPEGQGSRTEVDGLTPYLAALQTRLIPGRKLKIALDGGNGINGRVMSDFLRRQGHTVIELFTEPDGAFPNRSPDPTSPDALTAAAQSVLDQKADLGLAYDGDGDRLALIDDEGGVHFGDIILMLLARAALQEKPLKVVYDVSCTKALADDVIAHGGQAYPAAVGYAYIHEKMREIGATLGGETAGHIFCLDELFQFDDALLASVKLLNYVTAQPRSVSHLIDDLPRYHTSPNLRLPCPDHLKAEAIAAIVQHYRAEHPVETIDGAKILFPNGWALVRQSNTQPAISLRFEGETVDDLAAIQAEVMAQTEAELIRLGVDLAEKPH